MVNLISQRCRTNQPLYVFAYKTRSDAAFWLNYKWLWLAVRRGTIREMETELEIMQKRLYAAAVENKVPTLRELLQKDPLIVDKTSLNCQDKNLLHVAAMLGHLEFVKEVLRLSPDMCLAGDRFGRIPLHLAVIKGKLPVFQDLILARPITAREKTEGGGNVLHLCVKYNQLEALKFLLKTIEDDDFWNRKDDEGMTILHLAISDNQIETIKFLLHNKIIDVNAKNANGRTALDICGGGMNSEIARTLVLAGAERGKDISSSGAGNGSEWLYKKRDSLMVVASLIATMAFQAGLNPAGGVWQDDNPNGPNPHVAGAAVMAYKHPKYYRNFIRVNTVAFVSSLSTILLLISGLPFRNKLFCWALMVIMWLTISATTLTYGISIVMVTPREYNKSLAHVIKTAVTVWCGVMSLLLLGNTIRLINRWLKHRHGIDLLEKIRRRGNSAAQVRSNDQKGSLQMC